MAGIVTLENKNDKSQYLILEQSNTNLEAYDAFCRMYPDAKITKFKEGNDADAGVDLTLNDVKLDHLLSYIKDKIYEGEICNMDSDTDKPSKVYKAVYINRITAVTSFVGGPENLILHVDFL
jgi:hypothetical protein